MNNDDLRSMADRILEAARRDAGWHRSWSDANEHLSIKNAEGTVTAHLYRDGMIKSTNQGGGGALSWLQP